MQMRSGGLAVAALLLATGCGAATRGVYVADPSADPACPSWVHGHAAPLPSDVPGYPGGRVARYQDVGSGGRWDVVAPGSAAQLAEVRDEAQAQLLGAGYQVSDDTAAGAAYAQLRFSGPRSGSVRVQPLCAGTVDLIYLITS